MLLLYLPFWSITDQTTITFNTPTLRETVGVSVQ